MFESLFFVSPLESDQPDGCSQIKDHSYLVIGLLSSLNLNIVVGHVIVERQLLTSLLTSICILEDISVISSLDLDLFVSVN